MNNPSCKQVTLKVHYNKSEMYIWLTPQRTESQSVDQLKSSRSLSGNLKVRNVNPGFQYSGSVWPEVGHKSLYGVGFVTTIISYLHVNQSERSRRNGS